MKNLSLSNLISSSLRHSSIALLLGGITLSSASTLYQIPMQGDYGEPQDSMAMVHVYIRFLDQPTDTFSINIDPVVPQLTPLAISNPGSSFDPGLPWANTLDTAAFSRRYGFVMDGDSDLRPANTAVAIRFLSGSDGLDAWFYRFDPMEFTPIFTTGGSQATLQWNQAMTHPVFAADANHANHHITLEAYLADTANDWSPVAGYEAETFTLHFAAIPESSKLAGIAGVLVLLALAIRRTGRMRAQSRMPAKGFSTVETLCVVTVLAVLGSIALPMVSSVREQGQQLRCAANLRQLTTATQLYAQDNRGEWPRSGHSAPAHNQLPWPRALLPYAGYGDSSRDSLRRASARGGLYHCPADSRDEALGYALNVYLELHPEYDDYPGQPNTWRSLQKMPRPADTVLFGETRSSSGMSDHFMVHFWEGQAGAVATPHAEQANWAFADGRVERLPVQAVYHPLAGVDRFHPQAF